MGYLGRQVVLSALAANAIRPVSGAAYGIPSMVAGWWVSELAPHLLAVAAVDTLREVTRPNVDRRPVALGLANLAALTFVVRQSGLSRGTFEAGLGEVLELEAAVADARPVAEPAPWRSLVWPFRRRLEGVEVVKDVAYAPEHGRRGLLDVYRPAGDVHGAPVLLQVHGGAWTIGSKDNQGVPLMVHMAARGWVCVAVNYRLSPRDVFPAQLVDVKRAIGWIRRHGEEYGADPRFLAVTGGSAGGHLAALAALTPNDPEYQPGFEDADTTVQAAVPFYGVYDLAGVGGGPRTLRMRDEFLGPKVFRADPHADPEPFERASPVLRVRADAPPFYVIHGRNDTMVEVDQARRFVDALRAASTQAVAYSELGFTQHAFDVFPSIRSQHSVRGVERFLRWAYAGWRGEPVASDAEMEAGDPRDPVPAS